MVIEMRPLGEIAHLRAGYGFPTELQGRSDGEYPFAKVGDISRVARAGGREIGDAPNHLDGSELAAIGAKPFPPGTIVFAKIGEAIAQNFRLVTGRPMVFDNNVMGVVPDRTMVTGSYLLHFLRTVDFYVLAGKTSVPAIRKSTLEALQIPLPPLAEQRRIAAILDKADGIRRKRREVVKLADEFLKSAFLEMFGDPVGNPRGWPVKPLGQLCEFVGGGTPRRDVPDYFSGSTCWATSKDMKGELLQDTEEHITEAAIEESATKLVDPGAILVVVKSKVLMHRLPVAMTTVPTCFGQDLKAIIPHDRELGTYLARHLRIGQASLLAMARGVNTEGLTLEHLRAYRVMLPPKSVVAKWQRLEGKLLGARKLLVTAATESDRLFDSLVERAFEGGL